MRRIRSWLLRFAGLFDKARQDRELADELESHLQLHAEDNVKSGMTPEEARRVALIKLGGFQQTRERYLERLAFPFIESVARDLGYAARVLMKKPGFTAAAVGTLSLGIGASVGVFSVVHRMILRPRPYRDNGSLGMIWKLDRMSSRSLNLSMSEFADIREQDLGFEQIAAYSQSTQYDLSAGARHLRVRAAYATWNLLDTLGVAPAAGQPFGQAQEEAGPDAALLSFALWKTAFGGRYDIQDTSATLNGKSYRIVGVLPDDFELPYKQADRFDLLLLLPPQANIAGHNYGPLYTVGRLRQTATLDKVRAAADVAAARIAQLHPDKGEGFALRIQPIDGDRRLLGSPLLLMLGAVCFVLLISCANVGGLLLSQGLARRREFAVRLSLGASRSRLVGQLAVESVLLAGLGCGVGLLLALLGIRWIAALGRDTWPQVEAAGLNFPVLIFAIGATVVSALLFGVIPAVLASGFDVSPSLKEAPLKGQSAGVRRVRGVLVTMEVGLAVVMLTGAGLLARSFVRLMNADPGFRPDHMVTAEVSKYAAPAAQIAFYDDLLAFVSSIPGVTASSTTSAPPLGSDSIAPMPPVSSPAARGSTGEVAHPMVRVVAGDYFRALGIPVLAGREFSAQDSAGAARVAIVNVELAEQLFGSGAAVGQDLEVLKQDSNAPFSVRPGILRIVGVVGNIKHWFTGGTPHQDVELYLPFSQAPIPAMVLLARFDPGSGGPAQIQAQISKWNADAWLASPETMSELVSETIAPQRFYPGLLGFFALSALALALVGIYGSLSYSVRTQRHEIGVRMALGARPRDVLREVMSSGMIPVGIGMAIGTAGALGLSRLLGSLLYDTAPNDLLTFAGVVASFSAVALFATYAPARRASRVDPMIALRWE